MTNLLMTNLLVAIVVLLSARFLADDETNVGKFLYWSITLCSLVYLINRLVEHFR